ncbi:hypothetical protein [uncultured Gammaproteobacteria bacterium]|jgi:hypothetical protein|nr:hypothetical protein [uncultured Gammaproteobacteria bacterium]CAC9561888.1 hypothetical protein [uncultured Gammaproteobacteria bacterium]CAC9564768.1 hypothetical protein [uncultured Gammaproteobacteria bacterium]CAC9566650.1 hypothetical protein [uncultured Gammaproteobacteria bacterium]CAC9570741.1 hypothetical protein [uncultured Gammaproteobacteria bacterium]
MSFYLECFDRKTEYLVIDYKLKNVTVKELQSLMNVSKKRIKEDPEYVLSWRNNKVSKNKIGFFEKKLGRKIDLNKYIVYFSNLNDTGARERGVKFYKAPRLDCRDEDITLYEPPDWLDEHEISHLNALIKHLKLNE